MIPGLNSLINESYFGARISELVVFVGLLYLIHAAHAVFVTRGEDSRRYTLYLRQLKQSGAEMMGGNESSNAFVDEYMLLTDLVIQKLDFSVMKLLESDIPLLSRQEWLHAKMHREGVDARNQAKQGTGKWTWLVLIADFFLLRCGTEVAAACSGHVEATTGVWVYCITSLPFIRNCLNDEYLYHSMEEFEHGPLTTQVLRGRMKLGCLSALVFFPVMVVFYFFLLLSPPFLAFLERPGLFLQSKTYLDFLQYYAAMIPAYLSAVVACFLFWVLPFRQNDAQHQRGYELLMAMVQKRKIGYDIMNQATYVIDNGVLVPQSTTK